MRKRVNPHPLPAGTPVFPSVTVNYPHTIGLRAIVEGRAEIVAPGAAPHVYRVRFDGDADACERGPLHERHLTEGGAES